MSNFESFGTPPPPVLKARGIARTFRDGQRRLDVLKGVSIHLNAGETIALTGRSGSGKSTLLHLLGLLDRPDKGQIEIDGICASTLSEKFRARIRSNKIGFVFQHYFLLPEFTVLENLLMAAKVGTGVGKWFRGAGHQAREKAQSILEKVDLAEQRDQNIRTLSGGERQRVCLGRALMSSPSILLCDEPTGNLDLDTGRRIIKLIADVSAQEKVAVLIVTHDLKLAQQTNNVLVLENGLLHKTTTPK